MTRSQEWRAGDWPSGVRWGRGTRRRPREETSRTRAPRAAFSGRRLYGDLNRQVQLAKQTDVCDRRRPSQHRAPGRPSRLGSGPSRLPVRVHPSFLCGAAARLSSGQRQNLPYGGERGPPPGAPGRASDSGDTRPRGLCFPHLKQRLGPRRDSSVLEENGAVSLIFPSLLSGVCGEICRTSDVPSLPAAGPRGHTCAALTASVPRILVSHVGLFPSGPGGQ